jgi:hypothetical protein
VDGDMATRLKIQRKDSERPRMPAASAAAHYPSGGPMREIVNMTTAGDAP